MASELLLHDVTSNLRFGWYMPAEVGVVAPPLLRQMRSEAERALVQARKDAEAEKAGHGHDPNSPFMRHNYDENWTVDADTEHLLSLTGTIDVDTGDPHGVIRFKAILWDKQAGRHGSCCFIEQFAPVFARGMDWAMSPSPRYS